MPRFTEDEDKNENDILLDDFIQSEIIRLERFRNFWATNWLTNPNEFPPLAPEEEWLDQFYAFCSGNSI